MTTNKRLLRAAVICWTIALWIVACGLLTGCDGLTGPDTVPAGTPNEVYVISLTHQVASEFGTWADPKLTDDVYMVWSSDGTRKVPAAGWVPNGGHSHTIYYWRPFVNEQSQKRLEGVVRHEVEHVACQCDLGEGS